MKNLIDRFRTSDLYLLFLMFTGLIYLLFYVWHLNIVVLPLLSLTGGVLLRLFCKEKFILIFTALFPLLSPIAWFDNRGLPYNYLLISLLVLFGCFITDLFMKFRDTKKMLDKLNRSYLFFLALVFISGLFLFLRWSNITLDSIAFFSDTQIEPGGNRNSFGTVFPVIYIILFAVSPLYYLYAGKVSDKKQLVLFFLGGHSLSIIYACLQKYMGVRVFFWNEYNGLASDASGFGFLCVLSLFFSVWLVVSGKVKVPAGILFIVISLGGIFTSKTRIGIISIGLVLLLLFMKLNKKGKLWFAVTAILISSLTGYLVVYKGVGADNLLVGRIKSNITSLIRIFTTEGEAHGAMLDISGYRHQLWLYSLDAMKKYPLSGVGVGNYVFWVMAENHGKNFKHDLPSNQYLFFTSSIGVVGLLAFLLFIWEFRKFRSLPNYWLLGSVFVIMVVNNFLWLPEGSIGFWLILTLIHSEGEGCIRKRSYMKPVAGVLFLLFVTGNIVAFNNLHPSTLLRNKGVRYDYGLWKMERSADGSVFYWTKSSSGIFIDLNDKGRSEKLKLVCGAPIGHLKDKKQVVTVFWKGKEYRRFEFPENREENFVIEGEKLDSGFLELRVDPVFNLRKMGLSPESRTLGIQLHLPERKK